MIKVNIKYNSLLKLIVKKKSEEVDLAVHSSIYDLVDHLSNKYGPRFNNVIIDENKGTAKGFVLVNGKNKKMDYELQDQDEVVFLFFIGGG